MITYKNACDEICEEAEEWEPEVNNEEEDLVEEVILPGVDWESVCYQVPHLTNQDVVARVKSDFYQVTFRYVRHSTVHDRSKSKEAFKLQCFSLGKPSEKTLIWIQNVSTFAIKAKLQKICMPNSVKKISNRHVSESESKRCQNWYKMHNK